MSARRESGKKNNPQIIVLLTFFFFQVQLKTHDEIKDIMMLF